MLNKANYYESLFFTLSLSLSLSLSLCWNDRNADFVKVSRGRFDKNKRLVSLWFTSVGGELWWSLWVVRLSAFAFKWSSCCCCRLTRTFLPLDRSKCSLKKPRTLFFDTASDWGKVACVAVCISTTLMHWPTMILSNLPRILEFYRILLEEDLSTKAKIPTYKHILSCSFSSKSSWGTLLYLTCIWHVWCLTIARYYDGRNECLVENVEAMELFSRTKWKLESAFTNDWGKLLKFVQAIKVYKITDGLSVNTQYLFIAGLQFDWILICVPIKLLFVCGNATDSIPTIEIVVYT